MDIVAVKLGMYAAEVERKEMENGREQSLYIPYFASYYADGSLADLQLRPS